MFCDSPLWLTASTLPALRVSAAAIAPDTTLRRHLFMLESIASPCVWPTRATTTASAENYHLISITRPLGSNLIDRESAYVHVSMSPLAYSSLVVSRGSPQMAFTWLAVMPTRGTDATATGFVCMPLCAD